MSTRRLQVHLSTALLMLSAIACQDGSLASSLADRVGGPSFSMGGNSSAAHLCQKGGYLLLTREDGTGFKNAGDCTSYAAQGGAFATLTATFTNVLVSGCNSLTWGYELDGVQVDVASNVSVCPPSDLAGSDQTVSFLPTQTLRVFLRDNTCGWTFFEDGNHGAVTGANPYLIRIADGGGFCERGPDVPWTPVGAEPGNLNVTKTIS